MSSTFPGVSVELFNTQGFGRQFENPSFCQCMTTLNEWSVFRQWKSFSERVSTTRSVPFWTKITHMLLLCLSGQWISFACFFKQSFFCFLLLLFEYWKSWQKSLVWGKVCDHDRVTGGSGTCACPWLSSLAQLAQNYSFIGVILSGVIPPSFLWMRWDWFPLGFSPNPHLAK